MNTQVADYTLLTPKTINTVEITKLRSCLSFRPLNVLYSDTQKFHYH